MRHPGHSGAPAQAWEPSAGTESARRASVVAAYDKFMAKAVGGRGGLPSGYRHVQGFLGAMYQGAVLELVREVCREAPLTHPRMPGDGRPLSVQVTSCGAWGWWSDERGGYRYVSEHPRTGRPWPRIPPMLLEVFGWARQRAGFADYVPDTVLINWYAPDAKLGLHVDRSEDNDAPIVSVSLGADAVFLAGTPDREDKPVKVLLQSGDLLVQDGAARHSWHGIEKVLPTLTSPVKNGGRINLTWRRAHR